MPDWTTYLIYRSAEETPLNPFNELPQLSNAWTADILWAIYELEAPIRESEHFASICLAKDTSLEGNVDCSKSAFRSPLDLLLIYSNFTPG